MGRVWKSGTLFLPAATVCWLSRDFVDQSPLLLRRRGIDCASVDFDRLSKKLVTPVRQAATGRTSVQEVMGCCISKKEEGRAAHCMLFHIKLCYAGFKSILSSPLLFFFIFWDKLFIYISSH